MFGLRENESLRQIGRFCFVLTFLDGVKVGLFAAYVETDRTVWELMDLDFFLGPHGEPRGRQELKPLCLVWNREVVLYDTTLSPTKDVWQDVLQLSLARFAMKVPMHGWYFAKLPVV